MDSNAFVMHDDEFIIGLTGNYQQRAYYEKALYLHYEYFIKEDCRKYKLTYKDNFSAAKATDLRI